MDDKPESDTDRIVKAIEWSAFKLALLITFWGLGIIYLLTRLQ